MSGCEFLIVGQECAREVQQCVLGGVCALLAVAAFLWAVRGAVRSYGRFRRLGWGMVAMLAACIGWGSVKFQPGLKDNGTEWDSSILSTIIKAEADGHEFSSNDPVYISEWMGEKSDMTSIFTYQFAQYESGISIIDDLISTYTAYVWWRHENVTFNWDEYLSNDTANNGGSYANRSGVWFKWSCRNVLIESDTVHFEYRLKGSNDPWQELGTTIAQARGRYFDLPTTADFDAYPYEFNVWSEYVQEPSVHTNGVYNVPISRTVGKTNEWISVRVPVRIDGKQIMPIKEDN